AITFNLLKSKGEKTKPKGQTLPRDKWPARVVYKMHLPRYLLTYQHHVPVKYIVIGESLTTEIQVCGKFSYDGFSSNPTKNYSSCHCKLVAEAKRVERRDRTLREMKIFSNDSQCY
uniref:Uncharacterized protein n=1 Tax=Zosterops lateralis melanops TaxID=1220523 RepID=A0A8D2QTK5_ZOSLA